MRSIFLTKMTRAKKMLSELFEIDVIDSNNFILNNEKKNAPILNIRQICFTALLFFVLLIFLLH